MLNHIEIKIKIKKDLKPKGIIVMASFDLQRSGKKGIRVVIPGRAFEIKVEAEQGEISSNFHRNFARLDQLFSQNRQ